MAAVRVLVDSVEVAAEVLGDVMEHARRSRSDFEFGPISADSILRVGLYVEGDIDQVLEKILDVPGTIIST